MVLRVHLCYAVGESSIGRRPKNSVYSAYSCSFFLSAVRPTFLDSYVP